jgi:flagellar biosynthesis anti-sigma factor FlgM
MGMDIRNSLESLRTLLGATSPVATQGKSATPSSSGSGLMTDRATLSSAASEISDAAAGEGVRMEKVTAGQQALAAGTYSVPAYAVASKVMDAMLSGR